MTTRDLFELAAMDVLGLLDDEERRAFEDAFRAASPAVQAQVRREQLRMADVDSLLPRVDPPMGLKARVLGAVREAVEVTRSGEARTRVGEKVGLFTLALQRNVSPLWRAACIGLITASAVLAGALFQQSARYSDIDSIVDSNARVIGLAEQFGPRFAEFMTNPNTKLLAFNPGQGAGAADQIKASILIDEESGQGYLLCNHLPQREGGYRLVMVNEQGQISRVLSHFDHKGGMLVGDVKAPALAGASLAILPGVGEMSLANALLVTG